MPEAGARSCLLRELSAHAELIPCNPSPRRWQHRAHPSCLSQAKVALRRVIPKKRPTLPRAARCCPQADESLKQAQDAQRRQAAATAEARARGRRGGGPGLQWLRGLFAGAGLFGGAGCAPAGGGFPAPAAPAGPAPVEASGSGSSEDALIDLTLDDDEPPAQQAQQAQRAQQTQRGRAGMQQAVRKEEGEGEWEPEEVKEEEGDYWEPGGGGGSDWEPDDFGGELSALNS